MTLITPAYNEEAIIVQSITRLCTFMEGLRERYDYEVLIVNDGSVDQTGPLADGLAADHPKVRAVHHKVNRNLGVALQTGFHHARGTYVIVLDIDLSYSPEEHIEQLLSEITATDADIVIASPYMKGGKNTAVPLSRLVLSKTVNWLMRKSAGKEIYTFTSMVRVYNARFLKYLNLKSGTYDINPEIIFKAIILRARVLEIP
ncbi:MAG: glycosyltransferase family 2 protein, partial [Bacteroidia bacterium]|nr:glycosyltransferase family 2 protein [Bacteroidia bacterium]